MPVDIFHVPTIRLLNTDLLTFLYKKKKCLFLNWCFSADKLVFGELFKVLCVQEAVRSMRGVRLSQVLYVTSVKCFYLHVSELCCAYMCASHLHPSERESVHFCIMVCLCV